MPHRKAERIASRIRFLISSILQRELQDPRIGLVTILNVKLSQDLKEARVSFSVYGDPAVKSRTFHAIEQARGFIQKELGKNLDTRNVPRLRFLLDETQDKLARIDQLIEKAAEKDQGIHHGEET